MSKLITAALTYGMRPYPVVPTDVTPLPVEFDFNDPSACGKLIFAILSNASGGHVLANCRLRIHREKRVASLSSSGAYARYRPSALPFGFTAEEALKFDSECEVFEFGRVVTDQYGEGWKRARWTTPDQIGMPERQHRWRTATAVSR